MGDRPGFHKAPHARSHFLAAGMGKAQHIRVCVCVHECTCDFLCEHVCACNCTCMLCT